MNTSVHLLQYPAEFFLEREMCQTKVEEVKTHISRSVISPPTPEKRVVYEIRWKNTVQPDRPQMRI